MRTRSITVLVLIGYSAILINVVVFKGPIRLAEGARPGREERAEGGRQGRGRGDPRSVGGSESRIGRRTGPAPSALADTWWRKRNRFAPIHANYVPFKTILWQIRG